MSPHFADAAHIEFAPKVVRDLRKVSPSTLSRLEKALQALAQGAPNLDIKPLRGFAPWLRLRVGSYRVLYRPLNRRELQAVAPGAGKGYLVGRIVPRAELEREAQPSSRGKTPRFSGSGRRSRCLIWR